MRTYKWQKIDIGGGKNYHLMVMITSTRMEQHKI